VQPQLIGIAEQTLARIHKGADALQRSVCPVVNLQILSLAVVGAEDHFGVVQTQSVIGGCPDGDIAIDRLRQMYPSLQPIVVAVGVGVQDDPQLESGTLLQTLRPELQIHLVGLGVIGVRLYVATVHVFGGVVEVILSRRLSIEDQLAAIAQLHLFGVLDK